MTERWDTPRRRLVTRRPHRIISKPGGATSFVVHDTHGLNYRNIILDDLDPAAEYVAGRPVIFYEPDDLAENSYDGCAGYLTHPPSFLKVKRAENVTLIKYHAVLSFFLANLGTA